MSQIQKNAKIFKKLSDDEKRYSLYLGNDRKINISFEYEDFSHLEGLGQLNVVAYEMGRNSSDILHRAVAGKFKEDELKKAFPEEYVSHFVKNKVDYLGHVEAILDGDFEIYKYEKNKDRYSLKDNKHAIFSKEDAAYVVLSKVSVVGREPSNVMLFVDWRKDKVDRCYLRSFVANVPIERVNNVRMSMTKLPILAKTVRSKMLKETIVFKKDGFEIAQYKEKPLSKKGVEKRNSALKIEKHNLEKLKKRNARKNNQNNKAYENKTKKVYKTAHENKGSHNKNGELCKNASTLIGNILVGRNADIVKSAKRGMSREDMDFYFPELE